MAKTEAAAPDPEKAAEKTADIATLEALGAAQCPLNEVVVIMGWEKRKKVFQTAEERKAYQKGRALGLRDLRLAQLEMAKKSVPMATMLGRLYLGQSEQREQDESAPIDYAGIAERIRGNIGILALPGTTEPD